MFIGFGFGFGIFLEEVVGVGWVDGIFCGCFFVWIFGGDVVFLECLLLFLNFVLGCVVWILIFSRILIICIIWGLLM